MICSFNLFPLTDNADSTCQSRDATGFRGIWDVSGSWRERSVNYIPVYSGISRKSM